MKNNRNLLQKLFNYIRPLWEGNDEKISIRRCLAIAFSIDFIKLPAASEGFALVEAGLIAALLALTTYFNYVERSRDIINKPKTDIQNGNSNQILD
jgi:hypothetical protein